MNRNKGKIIKLQTCFALAGQDSDDLALPGDVKTMLDLLAHIGGEIDYNFLDPKTNRIEDDLEIILNQKEIWFYPKALDTELKDGDIVEVYLFPLGGG